MAEEKKIKRIHKIALGLLVTIIFTGFIYSSTKSIRTDLFGHNWKDIYQPVAKITGMDPEGTQVKYKLHSVYPVHDFRVDSITGVIYINTNKVPSNQFFIVVKAYDETGQCKFKSFHLTGVRYKNKNLN